MAAAIMKQFSKSHQHCAKTWVEPMAETNGKTVEENANWWIRNGERGLSSETMFGYLHDGGMKIAKWETTPSDPDDFRRCYLLLKAVPQWKSELHKLKSVSPVWSNLVDNWDKLTEMLEDLMEKKTDNGMYKFMKSLGC